MADGKFILSTDGKFQVNPAGNFDNCAKCCCTQTITVEFSGTHTLCTDCFSASGTVFGGVGGRFKVKSVNINGTHVVPLDTFTANSCTYTGTIVNGLTVEEYQNNDDGGDQCDVLLGECSFDVQVQIGVRLNDDGDRSVASVDLSVLIPSTDWCHLEFNIASVTGGILFSVFVPPCSKAPMTCKRLGDSINDANSACGLTVLCYGGSAVVT